MSKTVLVTGACGRVGSRTIAHLLARGHRVIAVDLPSRKAKRVAARYDARVEVCWANICDDSIWPALLARSDAVVHLAAVLPPLVDQRPELAIAVNQTATIELVHAMEKTARAQRLVFASSMVVAGHQQHLRTPPLRAIEPPQPDNLYAETKVAAETAIKSSSLQWSILRLAVVCPTSMGLSDAGNLDAMFDASVAGRLEGVHEDDAGLAFAAAVDCIDAIGHVLYIGGGPTCQTTVLQFYNRMFGSMGIGPFPEDILLAGEPYFSGDWLDTQESQRLLQFQRHSIDDILLAIRRNIGVLRVPLKLLSPLIVRILSNRSPHRKARYHDALRS
jgi:UDP-glucose 4-epimerase